MDLIFIKFNFYHGSMLLNISNKMCSEMYENITPVFFAVHRQVTSGEKNSTRTGLNPPIIPI